MTLLRTTFLSSLSYVVRVLTGFITNKVIAVYLGPSGLALLGQFNNFFSIFQTAANSINGGVVKYVAEYGDDDKRRLKIIGTAFLIVLASSGLVSAGVLFFSGRISAYVLQGEGYERALVLVGLLMAFVSMNSLFLSVLNGLKEIDRYIALNIFASVVGLGVGIVFVVHWGLYGALIASSTASAVVFTLSCYFMATHPWFRVRALVASFDRDAMIRLGKFAGMFAASAVLSNYGIILVRSRLIGQVSLDAAGYWQGMLRISDSYLSIITSSLSIYYLPRLSEIKDNAALRAEVMRGFRIILPVVAVLITGVFLARDFVIRLLYTPQFLPMRELFLFQLMGDFLKMASWLLGYLTVARAMTRWFIVSEVVHSGTYVALAYFFIGRFGLVGASYAHCGAYAFFCVFVAVLFRGLIFTRGREAGA